MMTESKIDRIKFRVIVDDGILELVDIETGKRVNGLIDVTVDQPLMKSTTATVKMNLYTEKGRAVLGCKPKPKPKPEPETMIWHLFPDSSGKIPKWLLDQAGRLGVTVESHCGQADATQTEKADNVPGKE